MHRNPVQIGDGPMVPNEGIGGQFAIHVRLEQDAGAARLECFAKTHRAHPPEPLERRPVDSKNRLPIGIVVADDFVVRLTNRDQKRPFHHSELGVRPKTGPHPYSDRVRIEGRGVDGLGAHRGQLARNGAEKLRATTIEPHHRICDHLVPGSHPRPEPSGGDRDGTRKGAVDTEKGRHLWESMKMQVVVASHPSALLHDTGPHHPERPARIEAIDAGIDDSGLKRHDIVSPFIERGELAQVHDLSYIEMIHGFCDAGGGALDMDTFVSRDSWDAALTAAGGVRAIVEELDSRADGTGFALCRPPGHHALSNHAMGFCLFNNVAVSAAYLRSRGERVAILDWDVHHGNGTQAMLGDDPGCLYVSLHQDHFYPFEGGIEDIDHGEAEGTIVNIPLPAGTAGDVYRDAWVELVLPVVDQFEPSWIFISAGFDAHAADHLAHLRLESPDYGWMASHLSEIHPAYRTIVVLEGGYDLTALRESARATLLGLSGEWDSHGSRVSPPQSVTAVKSAATAIARHWSI